MQDGNEPADVLQSAQKTPEFFHCLWYQHVSNFHAQFFLDKYESIEEIQQEQKGFIGNP